MKSNVITKQHSDVLHKMEELPIFDVCIFELLVGAGTHSLHNSGVPV
jgi:hypothetical protein